MLCDNSYIRNYKYGFIKLAMENESTKSIRTFTFSKFDINASFDAHALFSNMPSIISTNFDQKIEYDVSYTFIYFGIDSQP